MSGVDPTVDSEWLDAGLLVSATPKEIGAVARLAGSWCDTCGRAEFPARDTCPVCLLEMTSRPLSPTGTVRGATAVLHQPPGTALQAPYGVVAVEHDEGITVLGPLVAERWDTVAVGDRVRSVVMPVGDRLGFGYALD